MAAWLYRAADAGLARRIAVSLGVSDPVAYALARAFPDEADAERHLRPQLAHVSDPFAVGGLREAAERIVEYGADFKNNVSPKVDMLVIGDADFVQFADGMQTGKMKKAAALREDGVEIEIVAERDFLALLGS